jgi:hypothetical protein
MPDMAELLHPEATHHLPSFITPPGETDVLMIVTAFVLLAAVVGFGVFFLRLHALPEHIAHGSQKIQMEIVSVLCLIALFTHMHIFWIAALILAFVEFPDFGHPLRRIAGSVEKMAGIEPGERETGEAAVAAGHDDRIEETAGALPHLPAAPPAKPAAATASAKELSHA